MRKKTPEGFNIVCGWGINDSPNPVSWFDPDKGKRITCSVYQDWVDMLRRSCSESEKLRHKTYEHVGISEDFKYYTSFKKWVLEEQPNSEWENCDLDKDLLSGNVKIYAKETAVYITSGINTFISSSDASRGNCMLGVHWEDCTQTYRANCQNPFTKKNEKLGRFKSELEAHKTWQAKKHEHALRLADLQNDPRVADALRKRYAPDTDWTNR